MGHWYGDYKGAAEDAKLLGYVEARRQIYVPALHHVIKHHLMGKLSEIAGLAHDGKVVLLDYYTNGDVNNTKTPLSHAALINQNMVQHPELLI